MVFYPHKLTFKTESCNAPLYKNRFSLKVRRYAARLIDLNGYLAYFPGATMADKMGITELIEILLNSIPNSWYKQAYVQGFDCETVLWFDILILKL